MKKHNKGSAFCISKNKDGFWVGDVMHTMQPHRGKQGRWQPYIYVATFSKTAQNTLLE